MSARVVARPDGEIEEVHVLTTSEVSAKQSVRNVESALRAHFDLKIDHRTVSVAQTNGEDSGEDVFFEAPALRTGELRFLFVSHQVETERSHRLRIAVTVEWKGEAYHGAATGADLPRARLEATATATVRAIEKAAASLLGEGKMALSIDGVKSIEAFDGKYVLVAIHAIHGRSITALAGAAAVEDTVDRAVILGTLQAADRWVRGRI